ncbi:zinc ribbon domain-containing protein [Xanthobacter sp. V3C-3]|uniref:FmdB family zinc ribbon protein n=1 Tax=Xanthobacter lutulentifluminis TaxID=3119935 RepID=UPI00372AA8BE
MPLYSYHCSDCDNAFEILVGSSETPVCPACGSDKLDQLMSRIAPDQKMKSFLKAARAQAGREGHLSNFSAAERKR